MCSSLVLKLVDDVLEGKVKRGETFTAYGVTKDARQLTSEQFGHGEVRNHIHDKMEEYTDDGSYDRVGSSAHPAFEYQPTTSKKLAVSSPVGGVIALGGPTIPANVTGLSVASGRSPVVTHKPTPRRPRRFNISNKDIRAIGGKSGRSVVVGLKSSQAVVALPGTAGLDKEVTALRIDKDDAVRLSQGTLAKLGLKGKSPIHVTVRSNRLVLS